MTNMRRSSFYNEQIVRPSFLLLLFPFLGVSPQEDPKHANDFFCLFVLTVKTKLKYFVNFKTAGHAGLEPECYGIRFI